MNSWIKHAHPHPSLATAAAPRTPSTRFHTTSASTTISATASIAAPPSITTATRCAKPSRPPAAPPAEPAVSLRAAEAGLGLAYLPEDRVHHHLADGRLLRVLADWCPPFPGYHLYYPSRRQQTPAFTRLVETLRHPDSIPRP